MTLQKYNRLCLFTKILFLISIIVLVSSCKSIDDENAKKSIIIGNVEFRGDSLGINIPQFDAALNIASKLSGRFQSVPYYYWDSLSAKYSKEKSALELAKKGKIDYILFANVNVLQNIMRTEIVLTNTKDDAKKLAGVGYSAIKYIDVGSGDLLLDPTILESLERAMALAVGDSNLFVKPDLKLDVRPVPTLVIGAIVFNENEYSPNWDVAGSKEVNSYAAIETIFDVYKRNPNYVVYDSETRDSVYKLFGFNIVENYNKVTQHEVKALFDVAVDYYIAGNLEFAQDEAYIELGLYAVEKRGLREIKTVKESFSEDSREDFLNCITRASEKLIK